MKKLSKEVGQRKLHPLSFIFQRRSIDRIEKHKITFIFRTVTFKMQKIEKGR